ncbi:hypothetical protein AL755_09280 [Arthrobacter sp. ERGS1:01]|uniref:hypothetical protein n=1 Tax=Arthrobacter sp. ERGS1:01 TaxID=1704044 RepID=UPI0006B650AC|nr:hypothetical protein [Arthrobacter sp. ERGS1:01]ALE05628.1 hypothetical protein AL755_09280 [Arthrobacter sp. ERGS1:01]
MSIEMKSVRKLRVHWPIDSTAFARLAMGEDEVLREDQSIALLLQAMAESPELGDFGNYRHVFESGVGFEGFTVTAGANPTLGHVGQRTISPTFVFTTYFDASLDDDAVESILRRLVEIHPWEVPVIELSGRLSVSGGLPSAAYADGAAR